MKKQKICARFVPHVLTTEQRNQRIAHTQNVLEMVKNDLEFLDLTITEDKSLCFVLSDGRLIIAIDRSKNNRLF